MTTIQDVLVYIATRAATDEIGLIYRCGPGSPVDHVDKWGDRDGFQSCSNWRTDPPTDPRRPE